MKNVLIIIAEKGIIKKPQAEKALEIMALREKLAGGSLNKNSIKKIETQVAKLRGEICQLKTTYDTVEMYPDRLTNNYLSGLFDAEGCVKIRDNASVAITVAQISCPNLLENIRLKLEYGSVSKAEAVYFASGDNAEKFLQNIFNSSIVKRTQIEAALHLRGMIKTCGNSQTWNKEARLMAEYCKYVITAEKHK